MTSNNEDRYTGDDLLRSLSDIVGDNPELIYELAPSLNLVASAANGDIETDNPLATPALRAITNAHRLLAGPLAGVYGLPLPEAFWLTSLGQAIMQAKAKLTGDKLISRADAARMLFGEAGRRELMRIKRMAETGIFTPYRDASAPAHQSGLISLRELESWLGYTQSRSGRAR